MDAQAPAPAAGFVGIDVSKAALDAFADSVGRRGRFDNSPDGIARLLDWLGPLRVTLLVIEATGRYERAAAVALMDAGFEVAIVNPRQVRDFARSSGRLAETDAVDAQVLAAFGRLLGPRPTPRPSDAQLRASRPWSRGAARSSRCARWSSTATSRRRRRSARS